MRAPRQRRRDPGCGRAAPAGRPGGAGRGFAPRARGARLAPALRGAGRHRRHRLALASACGAIGGGERLRRRAIATFAVILGVLALAEFLARLAGLHTPLLYERTAYGYRALPNQSLRRFGNEVRYNAQGLRSEPLTDPAPAGELRVLCLGDSITYGGTLTGQAQTYPYLLQAELAGTLPGIRVLNASAAGWALENELGWLRAHGVHGARVAVLDVATHDLFQPFASSNLVGAHASFPERAPRLALSELLFRYLLPWLGVGMPRVDPGAAPMEPREADSARALGALEALIRETRARGAEPVVMFVEQPPELEPRDALTAQAKRAMQALLEREQVRVVSPRLDAALVRDGLHPNARGNRALAAAVAPAVSEALRRAPGPAPLRPR
jgi:lysophospholipase L1-like esterase